MEKDYLNQINSLKTEKSNLNPSTLPESATGPLAFTLTNDYLFRAMLQTNNQVLKGLISALIHLPPDQIQSVVIDNPIELGKAMDSKTFFLDISLTLNNNTKISLEMQVVNEHNWPERSLSYLCRSFDNLKSGTEYIEVKPVIQISILDFTLFPVHPEFYATYKFLNVKNYTLYSDKLSLSVLDLNHIDLATIEDKSWELDYWATLFKATTWEDLKMMTEKNEYIQNAAETIYKLTQEEEIRLQCQAREDYIRNQKYQQHRMNTLNEQLSSAERKLSSTQDKLASAESQLASLQLDNIVYKLSLKGATPEEIAEKLQLSIQKVTEILANRSHP